jgi:hypothetical protein
VLQLFALLAIYFSSELREATIAIGTLCIVSYYFPYKVFSGLGRIWQKKFPRSRKLLTKEEFEELGRIETEKALCELREFVKSPKCKNQWKVLFIKSLPKLLL